MRLILIILINIFFFSLVGLPQEFLVIANHNSRISKLTKAEVRAIFTGKDTRYTPLDQKGDLREIFYKNITSLDLHAINKIWAKHVFTGKGAKPDRLTNNNNVIQAIQNNPEAVGYILPNSVSKDIKVIYTPE